MPVQYDGNFYVAAVPKPMLKDYCSECGNCELEAVGVRIYDHKIEVPMLFCKHRGSCEHQRRMIANEAQRRAYERARAADELKKSRAAKQQGGTQPDASAGTGSG